MPFKRDPQTFSGRINEVTVGTGDNTVTLGGENVMPLFAFDAPIENKPIIGVEVSDLGIDTTLPKIMIISAFRMLMLMIMSTSATNHTSILLEVYARYI